MLATVPRPHDLLWPAHPVALRARPGSEDDDPHRELLAAAPWADASWLSLAPVVLRRDTGPAGWLPVGLRGRHRNERCAAWLPADAVARHITPEQVAEARGWFAPPSALDVPAVAMLAWIAPDLDAAGIRWGIAGGVGFALASGLPVLRADSDLDLIIRADDADAFERMADVLRAVREHATTARVDMQIDTPAGGFAFAESLRTRGQVLLKTARGPVMTQDPWRPDAADVGCAVASS
jgi:phosphoribosyl-dephospho-CoA transferase